MALPRLLGVVAGEPGSGAAPVAERLQASGAFGQLGPGGAVAALAERRPDGRPVVGGALAAAGGRRGFAAAETRAGDHEACLRRKWQRRQTPPIRLNPDALPHAVQVSAVLVAVVGTSLSV